MTPPPASQAFPLTRRTFRVLRWVALVIVLFGPIAEAAWAVHASTQMRVSSPEVFPTSQPPSSSGEALDATQLVGEYLTQRNPAVDALLPEGRGGTHFFEDLGPKYDGLAFPGAAAIAVSASAAGRNWPEAIELHERAHLMDAFLPHDVARLMSRMAPAAPDEYAATNSGEHFGEMAASAWEIVAPPGMFCVDGTPTKRLEDAETRVPGTSGFVLRYLSLLPARLKEDGDADLRATAERLSAPFRDEWTTLWRSVDARRRSDGTFEPWALPTIRTYLESRRAQAGASNQLIDRFVGVALLPSVIIVRAAGG